MTFAGGVPLKPLTVEVARLRPALLVYDSFMVVAPLIGRRLDIPYVGMRAGHAQVPAQAVTQIRRDPHVAISAACHAAVETLTASTGVIDASPLLLSAGPQSVPYQTSTPSPRRSSTRRLPTCVRADGILWIFSARHARRGVAGATALAEQRYDYSVHCRDGRSGGMLYAEVALATIATFRGCFFRSAMRTC